MEDVMKKEFLLSFVFTVFFHIGLVHAQWTVFDCSVLPNQADTYWSECVTTNNDGATEILSVVDDPDIVGNKLIEVDGKQPNLKEMWRFDWNANSDIGATILFRVKALDTSAYDYDFDFYIKDGNTQERLLSKKGQTLLFLRSDTLTHFNTIEWHIYRITITSGLVELYIDEAPISYLSGTGKSISVNFFLFGDGLESRTVGSLYDWITWNVSGAYQPGEGPALPDTLAGIETAVHETSYSQPENYVLYQNYPNPFNPSTKIRFDLARPSYTSIKVYNVRGRLIKTLLNEFKQAGSYNVTWNGCDAEGSSLPSGVYIYNIQSDCFKRAKKMTLMK